MSLSKESVKKEVGIADRSPSYETLLSVNGQTEATKTSEEGLIIKLLQEKP